MAENNTNSNNDYVLKLTVDTKDLTAGFNRALSEARTYNANFAKTQRDLATETKKTWQDISQATSAGAKQQAQDLKVLQEQYQKMADAARLGNKLATASKVLTDTGTVLKENADGLKQNVAAMAEVDNKAKEVAESQKQVAQEVYAQQKAMADASVEAFDKMKEQAKAVAEQTKTTEKQMEDVAGKTEKIETAEPPQIDVDPFAEQIKSMNIFRTVWQSIANGAAAVWHRFTAPAGEFSAEADRLREKIASIKDEMEKMTAVKTPTAEYRDLAKQVEKAQIDYENAKNLPAQSLKDVGLDESNPRWADLLAVSTKEYANTIEEARQNLEKLKAEQDSMLQNGTAFQNVEDSKKYTNLSESLGEYERQLADVSSKGKSMAGKLGSNIAHLIAKGAQLGMTQFGKTMQVGFSNLSKGVQSAVSHFNLLKRESNTLDSVVKKVHGTFTSFVSLLKTRIKRMFITEVFKDMKQNFGSMAKLSADFNTAVSSITNSVKAFGAQTLAIAEPLITVLAPALTYLIDMMTKGADKLAQFTARVTGHTDYTKATKGQYDYAKALEATASSSSNANKKAKEYKNTVLSFDELHKLNGDNTSDVTGISSAQLEKAQTQATAVNEIADKIWDALTKRDFKTAGQAMGEAVNAGFSWLRDFAGWDKNADKITGFLTGAVDTINGFFDGIKGTEIGSSIGDVFNTVIESFKQITDPENGIDFGLAGAKVGDTIVSAIRKTKWLDAGKSIVQGLQASVRYVNGIISRPGFFKEIGLAIAKAFTGIVSGFSPSDWSDVIAKLINGFGELLTAIFGDQDKFAEAGQKIAQTINDTFDRLEPETLTNGLNSFFQSIVTFAGNLVGDLKWDVILPKIKEALVGLDWATMFEAVAILASTKIPGIIIGAFKNPLVSGIALVGGLVISEIIKHWDEITEWFGGVIVKVQNACDRLTEIIMLPFKLLWDYSWAIVIKIGYAIDAAVDWVITAWGNIKQWFSDAVAWVKTAWEDIKEWVSTAGEWLLDKLKAIPNGVIAGIEFMVNKVIDGVNWMIEQLNKLNIDMPDWTGMGHIGFQIQPLSNITLPRLADGGFVGDGQLFIANEGGKAEMIGDIGGQTAVVNNEQIVEAVASGVRSAVMDVVMVMQDSNDNGVDGDIVLVVDSEELARASLRGQRRIDKRTSPTVSFA